MNKNAIQTVWVHNRAAESKQGLRSGPLDQQGVGPGCGDGKGDEALLLVADHAFEADPDAGKGEGSGVGECIPMVPGGALVAEFAIDGGSDGATPAGQAADPELRTADEIIAGVGNRFGLDLLAGAPEPLRQQESPLHRRQVPSAITRRPPVSRTRTGSSPGIRHHRGRSPSS
ncbi:MAG: hypothetical protein OXF74_09355 [Rhodobacteraceae bacterium]|nr:hypothetical protein [Paracoccaceae bacterium]